MIETEWRDGWLWTRTNSGARWWPANDREVITALVARVAKLEEKEKSNGSPDV